ncbi:hypothetical protein F5972_04735 [Microbispora cellulosiformans]|uniref:Uncharacterized protein n=1 Tax=Microbispora cellulosiformans TaxID=2614688 RepID=A0A5J5K7N5_9ACTN|nr:hypothetical protein [Microbispora cellulosiformans]KAA9380466.1 hypothetical protein F5972_04735 [Microbispora cellulosiformans]
MKTGGFVDRVITAAAVLIMDLVLLMTAGFAIRRARDRGVLCDGGTVFCAGGDPAFAQWQAEMAFRSAVAYGSFAVMAAILIVSLVVGRRRGRHEIVIIQLTALTTVAALAVLWEPYRQW